MNVLKNVTCVFNNGQVMCSEFIMIGKFVLLSQILYLSLSRNVIHLSMWHNHLEELHLCIYV